MSKWGYFQTAPPYVRATSGSAYTFKSSGPKLISSLIDLEYTSEVCRKGYPAGKYYALPEHPDVDEVNKIGGFSIEMDRLAIINGQCESTNAILKSMSDAKSLLLIALLDDPWRPATPASEEFANGGARIDTLTRPFKLIPNCWHHCDENGNKTYEPPRIAKIHQDQVDFVKSWLVDWKKSS